ncbi:MAG: hypothetical protein BWX71_02187 [Deltaproteobacteria bacterium ADurb.Bin072]|nr:MAG: hypothetical protein BWX71_02187 [Deltaproteobacteria bacterium ADurb.Bin072]
MMMTRITMTSRAMMMPSPLSPAASTSSEAWARVWTWAGVMEGSLAATSSELNP